MELSEREKKVDSDSFSQSSLRYWSAIPANIDGMLGGFSSLSSIDVQTSLHFLQHFLKGKTPKVGHGQALDCGAGIGRVTKHLLSNLFDKVDMVDQNPTFLQEARSYLGDKLCKVDRFICSGLQDFQPEAGRYDVIWVQWVFSAVSDEGVLKFLNNCKIGMKDRSILFIKENVSKDDNDEDVEDCSITRTGKQFRQMIRSCGYVIMKEMKQPKFPQELYEVRIFACRIPDYDLGDST